MAADASNSFSKNAGNTATVSNSNQSSSSTSSGASNSTGTSSSSGDSRAPTRDSVAKEGWGSKHNFMLSYGLKPYNTEDWQEGNRILDTFIEDKIEQRREQSK